MNLSSKGDGISLLLIGCGKMGGALLRRTSAETASTHIVDPAAPDASLKALANTVWHTSPESIPATFNPDIIVIAIKPQQMAATLPAYACFKSSVFLSIAAGVTIEKLSALLGGKDFAIVRSMPNLPASIGQGMTAAFANTNVKPQQRESCDKLLKAVGDAVWVKDEMLIDAVTALSGNGPGYVFALCEAMTKAGEALGLAPQIAARLARQTIIGSGALLAQSEDDATVLRQNVTSPGGTTEAAMKHLMATDGLPALMLKAMQAAVQRTKELAQ